jgi:hypothetical protein
VKSTSDLCCACAVMMTWLIAASHSPARAAQPVGAVPDFTGVYNPINPFGNALPPPPQSPADSTAGPPPPTRAAPTSDGRHGRPPEAPKLTPEYMARWETMRQSRMAGSPEFDPIVRCLPAGMPAMMSMVYGMELQQTRDKITIYSELNDMYRRIYLDGRKPSKVVLNDPTYAGYSTGHWEGGTLIVDTVALRADTLLDPTFSPHSDQMTVQERIRLASPGVLEDRIVVHDAKALTAPFETTKTYRKASPPDDELREFACAEGIGNVK